MNIFIKENDVKDLKEKGYIVINNFYNIDEIIKMRKIIIKNLNIFMKLAKFFLFVLYYHQLASYWQFIKIIIIQ